MIFIAKDYNGKVISIVNAKSLELANAFWQGRGVIPHTVSDLEKDYLPLEDHPTGVYELLKTKEREIKSSSYPYTNKTIIEVI